MVSGGESGQAGGTLPSRMIDIGDGERGRCSRERGTQEVALIEV